MRSFNEDGPLLLRFKELKKIQNIGDVFNLGRLLGQGSFGKVYLANRRGADTKVAIKTVDKS